MQSTTTEPTMTPEQIDQAKSRIAEIDRMFERAMGWGSWMIMCANEREDLVDALLKSGISIPHKYQARTSDGAKVD